MDRLCVTLIALVCVIFSSQKRISGAEVELRVRPGDNATLYCDCIKTSETSIEWFTACSRETQSRLKILGYKLSNPLSHFTLVWNSSNKSKDLVIEDITDSELGFYYCAVMDRKAETTKDGKLLVRELYRYGNITTRVSYPDPLPSPLPPTPPPSDCLQCWMLLVSVCPVCSLLSSTCVYCLCRRTGSMESGVHQSSTDIRGSRSREQEGERELCYTTVNIPNKGHNRPKKKRVQNPDFITYSEVKTSGV